MRSASTQISGLILSFAFAGHALATTTQTPSAEAGHSTPPAAATVPGAPPDKPVADAVPPAEQPKAAEPAPALIPAAPAPAAAAPAAPAPAAAAPDSTSTPPATTASEPTPPAAATTAAAPVDENTPRKELLKLIGDTKSLTKADREALTAFYEGRGDDLLWVSGTAFTARAQSAMAEIAKADDWGLDASAFELPAAPAANTPADLAAAELKFTQAIIKYASHARGGRMDPKQLSNYIDRDLRLVPTAELLTAVAATDAADGYLRKLHPQHPQFEKLRQAYLSLKNGVTPVQAEEQPEPQQKTASKKQPQRTPEQVTLRKLLINMEQWRWMPDDLGQFHVWANIPEFTVRVMKDGHPVFTERLIAGKTDTQTPIFSDKMAFLVFHPFWGVPDSIKMKEILPGLARGSSGALSKNNLRIQYRGRDIDPGSVDWATTDIRNFHVYQPPGGGNVLGQVKFMFPNKHQVYMHDTPTKNLFNSSQRTFSHGCMRIRNPLKFAEVLLSHDKGWDGRRIASLVNGGPENNNINLDNKIPVHITYFTAWVNDDGKLDTRADIYGHEQRIQMGLDGKAHLIVKRKEELGPVRAEAIGRLAETKSSGYSGGGFSSKSTPDWARKVFGN